MKAALGYFALASALLAAGFVGLAAGQRALDLADFQKDRVLLVARAASYVAGRELAGEDEAAAGAAQRFAAAAAAHVPGAKQVLVLKGTQFLAHSTPALAKARLNRESLSDKALYDQLGRLRATFQKNRDERARNPALDRDAYAEVEARALPGGPLSVAAPVRVRGDFAAMAEVQALPAPLPIALPWLALLVAALATALFAGLAAALARGAAGRGLDRRALGTLLALGLALVAGSVVLEARAVLAWRGEARRQMAASKAETLGALAASGLLEAAGPGATDEGPEGMLGELARSPMGTRTRDLVALTPAGAAAPGSGPALALAAGGSTAWFAEAWFEAERARDAGHLAQWGLGFFLVAGGCFALGLLGQLRRFGGALVEHRTAYAYLSPAMVGMVILVFVPVSFGIVLGFMDRRYNVFEFAGLSNYVEILSDFHVDNPQNFYFKLGVTVLWTGVNVGLHVSIGLFLALLLNDPILRARGLLRVLLIVPWAVPNYITGLIWKGMFHKQFGAVNFLLDALGVAPVSWFQDFGTAFATNVITNTWLGFPFMMVISLGALQSIPADLYEAAEVDGSTRWQRFRLITLPLLMPALVPAVIVGTVWTFNMFNIIYLVSGGAPNGATDILITDAFRWAFERDRYGYAAAYSTIIFLLLLAFTVATNKVTRATKGAFE